MEEIISHLLPKSTVAECFRTLRTNIQFTAIDKKVRTILITSCFPGEGKSWVSANLAIIFAQTGKRVLLIDADMRKGRQDEIFNVGHMPGLSNILADGMEDVEKFNDSIKKTKIDNLFIIPVGNMPPNPSELLSSTKMAELLEKLKYDFDVIILDGTPSAIVADSVILSRLADATLIVTAAKKTAREHLVKLKKSIEGVGGKISGVILNKVQMENKEYYGYQYYYATELISKPRGVLGIFGRKKQTDTVNVAPAVNQKPRIDSNGIVVNIEPKPKIDSNVVMPNNNVNEKSKVKFKGKMSMKAAK